MEWGSNIFQGKLLMFFEKASLSCLLQRSLRSLTILLYVLKNTKMYFFCVSPSSLKKLFVKRYRPTCGSIALCLQGIKPHVPTQELLVKIFLADCDREILAISALVRRKLKFTLYYTWTLLSRFNGSATLQQATEAKIKSKEVKSYII